MLPQPLGQAAALMLLRDKALQEKYQIFNFNDWERGAYSSPLTTGTRPAGAIAAAWAIVKNGSARDPVWESIPVGLTYRSVTSSYRNPST